jgi:hypothetical protein
VFIAAAGIYCFSALTGSIIMVVAVLISRAGLWLFDLCARQISQETIDEDSRGVVNGQWASLTSFFNLSSYALACLFSGNDMAGGGLGEGHHLDSDWAYICRHVTAIAYIYTLVLMSIVCVCVHDVCVCV